MKVGEAKASDRAYIILLNWNGWQDTIECLESVFRTKDVAFRVIVCDNASADNSLGKIKEWASGELEAQPMNPHLSPLISPPISKPIAFCELSRNQSESEPVTLDVPLVLIQNGTNLGFAGGNNVGLRYALKDDGASFFWILNNDTVVKSDALSALVRRMQQPGIGLCGSLTLYYYDPETVQVQGGLPYNRWTGRVPKLPKYTVDQLDSHPASMVYVNGASLLASRAFLEQVGLMEESYGFYFEEMDWAMRARRKFELGYARESVIYHKEGATLGSSQQRTKRSLLSDVYLSRNRALFTKRFLPWALPTVLLSVTLAAAHRLITGDAKRAKAMFLSMLEGLMWSGNSNRFEQEIKDA